MNKQKILDALKAGENICAEFKESKNNLPKTLFETICAFLNTKGGTVYLGVNDNGIITGVEKEKINDLKKDIANLSNNPEKLYPPYFLNISGYEINNKTILLILVPESSQVHNTNGKIFIRNEDGDFRVTHPVEIAKIVNRKQNYYSEQAVVANVSLKNFNTELILRAKQLIKRNNPEHHWLELDDESFFKRIGFLKTDEHGETGFTLAAVLFFGTDELIQNTLPAYKIEALLRKENIDRYDDRLTITTNLIDAYDLLMGFMEKHLNDPFYLEGDMRISLRSKIFRELIANIIAHREYMSPQPAVIDIFKNKIEFFNPNNPKIFGKINPDNFTPVAKNPSINKLMIQMGRAEDIGSGIRNVTKYLPYYSKGAKVEFIDGDMFSTIIHLNETSPRETGEKIREKTREKIVVLIMENPYMTIKDFAKILEISEKGVEYQLNKLTKEGIIEREGSRKTGKWIVRGKK